MTTPLLERFMDKFEVREDGCWIWNAATIKGYGAFRDGDEVSYAHRWFYEHLVGEIPEGLETDHLCRTPECVNPDHLELVTHRENILRGESPSAIQARQFDSGECFQGHELNEQTLYVRPDGRRECRECRRVREGRA